MRKTITFNNLTRLVLMDSASELHADDAGAVIITGSHAGLNVADYALRYPLRAIFFNDAGVGKDDAGIAALPLLQNRGLPAGTVTHTSARIGDAADTYANGVLSHLNQAAQNIGIKVEERLNHAVNLCFIEASDSSSKDIRIESSHPSHELTDI